jgi:hypothetical protein
LAKENELSFFSTSRNNWNEIYSGTGHERKATEIREDESFKGTGQQTEDRDSADNTDGTDRYCTYPPRLYTRVPPLWPSGQSSWLQIPRFGFDSRGYQIFCEVAGLERGRLSLVSTIEELLRRKSGGSSLESREYGRRDPSR